MKNNVFKVVLLQALPASGKSEVRNFMAHVEPGRLQEEFHIGENLQLDDFPYVHMMRRIDNELQAMGQERVFYPGEEPFKDGRDWGTLCNLLNEDYHDLMNRNVVKSDSASILEKEARTMLNEKHAGYPESFENKTIIIECARGGPDGASMPLTGTFGYQYSLPMFCPEILENAVILYIWVTPEESRRKNADRADPNDPGSNLHHGVPMAVMLGDYGCDDMEYLIKNTDVEDTVTVKAHGTTYHVPIGVFDNRVDKTSFLRSEPDKWDKDKVAEVTKAIRQATDAMFSHYNR